MGGGVEWAHALGDGEVAQMVRVVVGMGADVNGRLEEALPLMTYCAARGCVEAVKACLAAGAEVDAPGDDYGNWMTALVHAGRGGHEAVVEVLLEAGASPTVGEGDEDHTLATVCEVHPTPGIVRRLVEAGADVNAWDEDGYPSIVYASERGDLALMKVLVELGADVRATTENEKTAMHEAASAEVVRWLAARGASVQGDGVNDSPLQRACAYGRVDAVRALIELGADVNYKGREPATAYRHRGVALRYAVQFDHPEIAVEMTRLLLAAGADVKAVDDDGQTPLHWVWHPACVDLLLAAGADLEARHGKGMTPICVAASDLPHRSKVVLRMADRGADLVNTGGEAGMVERVVAELQAEYSGGQAD